MSEGEAEPRAATPDAPASGGVKIARVIKIAGILGILLILLLLLAALAAALTAAEAWAPVIQIFRDIFLLILLLESVLLIAAICILLLQAAAFLIMLRAELKPILENARETARLSRATAQFVNSNAVDPLIQIKSFLAGLLAFLRELIRLRAAISEDQDEAARSDAHEAD